MESINSLIVITEKEVGERYAQCVNGKDLHSFLEVGTRFNDWIMRRIEVYGFQRGIDYEIFNEDREKSALLKNEYSLTLEMAKELCMVERNEKGRQARRYFIEVERRYKDMYKSEFELEAGTFTTGLRTGITLTRVLDRNGFDLADAARLVWYRKHELTQEEAAKLFDKSRDKIQTVEKALKDAGIELPAVHGLKRSREMRDLLDNMLGFKDRGLRLLKGGAC